MSSNSSNPITPPMRLQDISSPLFTWQDCFSTTAFKNEPMEDASEEQNQHPPLPKGEVETVKTMTDNTHTMQQTPVRDHSPLAELNALPMFDHPFQALTSNSTLTPEFTSSLTPNQSASSDDSETSSSTIHHSPSLSPISPDDTSPPPQKKLKKEAPARSSMSMFHAPQGEFNFRPSGNYSMRHHDNDLMRELNQLPSMLHPAALPCILPDENGEEQLSRASPRLAPTKVKKENKKSVHPSNLELKSTTNMRAILSGKRSSRKKTNVACTNCVRAKAGCDQGRPCSRCTRLGKPNCVDRPINSRRRRKLPRRFADAFADESSFQDSTDDVFKPKANEFIIGSYNGDVDGYIDYYMAQVPAPLSQAGYNPMRSYDAHGTPSAIPPPPLPPKLPPIPSLNAMAPQHHSPRSGMIYYGQTNWAMCPNPMLGSIPMTAAPALRDDLPNTGSLFATGDIRDQDLSHSSALSAMDMSKPSQTPLADMSGLLTEPTMKHEPMRPSTTSPKPLQMYYY